MATRDEIIGTEIGRYLVLECLGAGGMGVVYKGRDQRLGRVVALKLLPLAADEAATRRLLEEARAASLLDHPNVCAIHDIGTHGGRPFICMAFCPGESLKARLTRGPLPVAQALDVALQVVAGLIAAHERGMAHCDIKPANLIMAPDGRVKIVDFGLTSLVGLEPEHRPGVFMGTLPYMSPEQTRGEPVDHRSDIWSLGVTLYEMLAGAPPFGADENGPVLFALRSEPPPPLRQRRPQVPPELEAVILRCLEKDRHRRYRIAIELERDLLACRPTCAPLPAPAEARLLGRLRRRLTAAFRAPR